MGSIKRTGALFPMYMGQDNSCLHVKLSDAQPGDMRLCSLEALCLCFISFKLTSLFPRRTNLRSQVSWGFTRGKGGDETIRTL